jgi:hypothetical protein
VATSVSGDALGTLPTTLESTTEASRSARSMVLGRDCASICLRAQRSQQRDLTVLARYGSAARGDPLYEAMVQVGKLLRTVFLCDYSSTKPFAASSCACSIENPQAAKYNFERSKTSIGSRSSCRLHRPQLDTPSYVDQSAAGCGARKEGNFMYDSGGASSRKLGTP